MRFCFPHIVTVVLVSMVAFDRVLSAPAGPGGSSTLERGQGSTSVSQRHLKFFDTFAYLHRKLPEDDATHEFLDQLLYHIMEVQNRRIPQEMEWFVQEGKRIVKLLEGYANMLGMGPWWSVLSEGSSAAASLQGEDRWILEQMQSEMHKLASYVDFYESSDEFWHEMADDFYDQAHPLIRKSSRDARDVLFSKKVIRKAHSGVMATICHLFNRAALGPLHA
ncbi:hypothetical protein IE53DRAFT_367496 [Violaceomyces palustris]|uniref:Uncharacterized protein n=1 Tax=Violaceomyces palustris TaxID=1673888 RepID=A0ACD0P1W7_9BASI|nr:hypothetical protein IE53DRAFT_367496 [Violaceomyces palustris]